MANSNTAVKQTDYLIIGAGAMGMAFADEIFNLKPNLTMTIVDQRAHPGGHWNDAYPFVRLHQPAAFYGVNSRKLGNGTSDLSSKADILDYYQKVMDKFVASGRVEFLSQHRYLGNGQVTDIHNSDNISTYQINRKLVDATYMKVEVPSTHAPKYEVADGVPILPINDLTEQYDKWEHFYVIGNGKTGMDAVLYLIGQGVELDHIHWVCPSQAWLFNRNHIQIGTVGEEILNHAQHARSANHADDIFLKMEKTGGIMRLDESTLPKKWRCATVNPEELARLRTLKNIIQKGRVKRITNEEIELDGGTISYSGKSLFVDSSANSLAKMDTTPIFSEGKITLQSLLFCQQVFSAALIAKLDIMNISDKKKNKIVPVPHPELKEDWPSSLAVSIKNLLIAHQYFPMWMFRSRLNFISHEPILKYFFYAAKAMVLSPSISKAAQRMDTT